LSTQVKYWNILDSIIITFQAIIAASALPMSIIIIGVGEADFSEMEELDCDGGKILTF